MDLHLDGGAHLDSRQLITYSTDARQSFRLITVDVFYSRPENYTRTRVRQRQLIYLL